MAGDPMGEGAAPFAATVRKLGLQAEYAGRYLRGGFIGSTDVDEGLAVPFGKPGKMDRERRALHAEGWRILPAPRFIERRTARNIGRPALEWEAPRWVAIPPESSAVAARTFDTKRDAIAWARSVGADAAPPADAPG